MPSDQIILRRREKVGDRTACVSLVIDLDAEGTGAVMRVGAIGTTNPAPIDSVPLPTVPTLPEALVALDNAWAAAMGA